MNHRGLYQSKNMGKGLHCNFGLNDAEHYPSDRDGSEVDIVLSEQRYSVETVPRVNVVPKRAPEIRHDIAIAIARGLRNARELTVEIMNDNLEQVEPSAMAPGGPWPVVWNGKGYVIFFLPRAGADSHNPGNLPYYMERNHNDHRPVSFDVALRTIAKRENQFIHIVEGSGDCPVCNENITYVRYDLVNNEGY